VAVDAGPRRHGHGDEDAGDRRVHAGAEEQQPHRHADDRVDRGGAHPTAVRRDQQGQEDGGRAEVGPVQRVGVEDRDHQHGAEVVGDGQGGEEDLERGRHAVAEQRHDADGERDVGGHRHAPAAGRVARRVQREVERGGQEHAADGAGDREHRLARSRQLAGEDLALDLEADDEEEDRHQAVVDPEVQWLDERDPGD
jgi:hypothetical protein